MDKDADFFDRNFDADKYMLDVVEQCELSGKATTLTDVHVAQQLGEYFDLKSRGLEIERRKMAIVDRLKQWEREQAVADKNKAKAAVPVRKTPKRGIKMVKKRVKKDIKVVEKPADAAEMK